MLAVHPTGTESDTQKTTMSGFTMQRYVIGTNPPGDGLNGLWDGVLSVLLVLAVVAVVTLGLVGVPFMILWRLLTRPYHGRR